MSQHCTGRTWCFVSSRNRLCSSCSSETFWACSLLQDSSLAFSCLSRASTSDKAFRSFPSNCCSKIYGWSLESYQVPYNPSVKIKNAFHVYRPLAIAHSCDDMMDRVSPARRYAPNCFAFATHRPISYNSVLLAITVAGVIFSKVKAKASNRVIFACNTRKQQAAMRWSNPKNHKVEVFRLLHPVLEPW